MKKALLLFIAIVAVIAANAQHLGSSYRLKKVLPVSGRQGIAIDKDYYYVSDTRALYKYDKEGNMVMKNLQPFKDPERANHFGDIDIFNGEIYCGVEKFEYGHGQNIAVSVYDAKTLEWKRDIKWEPASGQVEVSGIAIDREKKMVWMGRMVAFIAIAVAVIFEWEDLLGIGGKGGFTFIQEYTGFISPGVFAMFILGMFWKRTTGAAAVAGLIVGLAASVFFKAYAVPLFGNETLLYTAFPTIEDGELIYRIPFLINMGWAFFFTMLVMISMSLAGPKVNPKAFALDKEMFRLKPSIVAMIVVTILILAALYIKFW